MGLIKSLLLILTPAFLFAFLALNGFLGKPTQTKMEDLVLNLLGESRGSYFLKNTTPLKDTPLQKQTSSLVDAGQATYVSGRKTGDDILGSVDNTVGDVTGAVGNVL